MSWELYGTLASPIYTLFGLAGISLFLGMSAFTPGQAKPKPKAPAQAKTGAQVYQAKCAPCHGVKGQGGAAYPKPLNGTQSVGDLSKFIAQQMPPGPVKCAAPDAAKVAQYMFDTFYSPLAQERNRPARVSLSRLTVRQFKNSVTDLISGMQPSWGRGTRGGLSATYFRGRLWEGKDPIKRVDSSIRAQFGTEAPKVPGLDQVDPHKFSIRWVGSVEAPDTGEYEFIVRSDQAVRLYLNGQSKPFIDGWIRSSNDNEFRASVPLIGGQAYPIVLEFSKSTVGVDDTEKRKKLKPAPAFVELQWKRPKLAVETIPSRFLFSQEVRESYVVAMRFPADDRSIGYERGSSVSKAWDDATTESALDAAGYVASHCKLVTGVDPNAADAKKKLAELFLRTAERAFRRPLTPDQKQLYVEKHFVDSVSTESAIKRSLLMILKSPRFLYREIGQAEKDSYLVASQLAYGLWDTLPDEELLRAAAAGSLVTKEQVEAQANRMVRDPRAWAKLREFLLAWLKVDEIPDLVKSAKRYPEFDNATASDLRQSLEILLQETAGSEASDYRQLMLTQQMPMNGRLAQIYGGGLPKEADFQPVKLGDDRAGVLTHPYMLSRLAYLETSSPIHRGVLVARSMLGRTLQPPPAAFAPLAPSLHPGLTTRQRVAMQTKPDACNSCHSMINPLGFAFERFDAIGKARSEENSKAIDSTGFYRTRGGAVVKFSGPADLANYLANSDEAHAAFTEKLFHHMVKQPALAYRPTLISELKTSFVKNQFSIKRLMAETVVQTSLATERKPAVQTPKGAAK
jgi:hypothetical protein